MRATEFIIEAKVSIKDQILADVKKHGGSPDDYFVRFTKVDKLGFSDNQLFKRHVDVDHPKFTMYSLGSRNEGRRALWFYPLKEYLQKSSKDEYAMDYPYVWLVKIKPNAWLQPVTDKDSKMIQPAPENKERVGILKQGYQRQAVFFAPAYDLVGRYYDYASQHQRHGEVKGKPEPSLFQKIRDRVSSI